MTCMSWHRASDQPREDDCWLKAGGHRTYPSVVERSDDEDELTDDVDGYADDREDEQADEESDRLGVREASVALERRDRDKERDTPHDECRDTQTLEARRNKIHVSFYM
jgi:hypothetical protein